MQIIGIRKMAVIMWCASCVTVIEIVHVLKAVPSDATTITVCALIAGLGGFHAYRQGLIDKQP